MTSEKSSKRKAPEYPSASRIKHAIKAARDAGVNVAAVQVAPDGKITLSEAQIGTEKKNDVESWFDREAG